MNGIVFDILLEYWFDFLTVRFTSAVSVARAMSARSRLGFEGADDDFFRVSTVARHAERNGWRNANILQSHLFHS
jgi:hypothetical protein